MSARTGEMPQRKSATTFRSLVMFRVEWFENKLQYSIIAWSRPAQGVSTVFVPDEL